MKKFTACLVVLTAFSFTLSAQDTTKTPSGSWQIINAKGAPANREDCGFVEVNDHFYLLGGRGIKTVDVFDPATSVWTNKGNTPFEIHHFQAVAYKNKIYVIGGMTGRYPHETPLANIYIYNPQTDEWEKGPAMPAGRLRGGGGTVIYKNNFYLVGGIQDGHYDGTVTWMDEFDPETGAWRTMPDAPRGRDHAHAVMIGNKLYFAGGRRTSVKTNELLKLTIPEVDVFDFKTNQWTTLPSTQNLPTLRGGGTAVAFKKQVVVMGGESDTQVPSHNEAEAFDTKTGTWTKLPHLAAGRHDMQAIVYKNKIYIAVGAPNRGGGNDLNSIEVFTP